MTVIRNSKGQEIEVSVLPNHNVEVSIDDMPGCEGAGASITLDSAEAFDLVNELCEHFGWNFPS